MKKPDSKSIYLLDLWLVLFAAALLGYVLGNKPLYWMVLHLRPIGFALAFVVSFCGIGAPFVRWLYPHYPQQSKTDEILASFALGLGLTGLFTFVSGILGIINLMLYALWTLCGLALFIYTLLRRWLPISLDLSGEMKKPLNILAILVMVPFLLQLIPPLVSPVVSTDALEYHLLIPKIFLNMGKIDYIPSLLESNYPCLAEYIYLLVMPIAGDVVCKSLHFWTGIFLLFAMGRLIVKVNPGTSRLLGPGLYLSMPVFVLILGWAWNDAFFVFFLLLCIRYLLDYQVADEGQRSPRSLFLAGIMAGLASWMKYTFVMIFLVFILLLIVALVRWRWKWYHLFWFFLPIGVISMLVFIKNWAFTGNPFYPFLNSIFHSPYWTDAANEYFNKALNRWEMPDWNWTSYFLFPFRMTLKPVLIDTHPGILPLVLIPMLFFRSFNKGITFLKTFIVASILVWLLIRTETRSLLTMLAVFFCIASIGLERMAWNRKAFRRPLVFCICLAVLANLVITIATNYHLTKPINYFLGLETRKDFLLRNARSQLTYEWLNRSPGVGKVLLVGFFGPYYLEKPAYFSSVCDPPIAEVLSNGIKSPGSLRQKFHGLGITHVAIDQKQYKDDNRYRLYGWSVEQKRMFEDFIAQFCQPVVKFGNETIYRLKN
ncbi:MAG: glycosyltransferase family 39 protein [Candidatus Aminicenantes bacterium]|nr:MAG: glycosyltransferase family 39 protein [Candidatus Aminicenantes bacterium]